MSPFDLVERHSGRIVRRRRTAWFRKHPVDFVRGDRALGGAHEHDPLDDIAEFAYVARPGVREQAL